MSDPYQSLGHLTKALADPSRLFILERVAQGPCAVDELAGKTGLPIANLSHHLQILKYAGLVKASRNGRQIVYSLQGKEVIQAIQALQSLANHLAGQDTKVTETLRMSNGPRVARDQALQLIKEGKAVVLDVRPIDEYRAGHIRGAIHIPLAELPDRLEELPSHKMIVAYCRGPYCQLAVQATDLLIHHGRSAQPLEDGYPEWWASGHPVEGVDTGETDP